MAGDWIAQGPGTHGAKGLSQEKAYVTGLQAVNQVSLVPVLAFSLRLLLFGPPLVQLFGN